MSNPDFLPTYVPLANEIADRTNIDPSVVLGIIDTETGGGTRVSGNNIFGISPGNRVAQYPDVQTGAQAFVDLMQQPRYRNVAAQQTPEGQAAALVQAGYNTVNKNYAALVTRSAYQARAALGVNDNSQDPPPPPGATQVAAAPPPPGSTAKQRVLQDLSAQPATDAATGSTTTPAGSTAKERLLNGELKADAPASTSKAADGTSLADAISSPEALSADVPQSQAPAAHPPTKQDIVNWLSPDPNMIYGSPREGLGSTGSNIVGGMLSPFARDPKTGLTHLTLPPALRTLLLGLVTTGPLEAQTWDPKTGTYGLTPEAMALLGLGAGGGMRSGKNPLEVEAPGPFARRPIPPDAAASILNPDAAARIRAAQGQPVDVAPPTVPTPFNTARAPAEATPPTPPPVTSTGVPVTPPPVMPTSESPASIAASGGYRAAPNGTAPVSGVGGAAGAQVTPSYEAIHTPAEEQAYRSTAEGKKLLEPQLIGERDLNQYIPGETASSAEREQTVKAARELKELGIRVPEASQLDRAAAEGNNTARTIYAENTAKTPVDILNRNTQRETDINADKAVVFDPQNVTGPFDRAPVIAHMENVLSQPINKQNSALQAVYRPLLERIRNADVTDPMEAWGLRQDIDRMTRPRAMAQDHNLHAVAHNLNDVAGVIDQQIEKVAPGYDKMLGRYKEHSRAIDEMTVLQGALKNLRGPGQTMTYNDFQRFMKTVVDSRMTPSTDLNPYKAISEENMQRLWNLRDSLRRTASAKELARAAGSDTMPNIIDALKAIGKMGGVGALHAYAGAHLGPAGNLALQSLGAIGKTLNDRRMIRRATQQMRNLLNPSEPLRVPPGQENPLTGAAPPP
jgi:hypothetical protein